MPIYAIITLKGDIYMKKILLVFLMLTSIFVITSCGKKKVLTKRTMDNFYDDFTFAQNEAGQKSFTVFKAYSNSSKAMSNEFSTLSSYKYNRLDFITTKKIKIEKISFTVYNKSTDKTMKITMNLDNEYSKLEKGLYFIGGNPDSTKKEILSSEELECSATYDNLVLGNKTSIKVLFGVIVDNNEQTKTNIENGGLYNFKIEYSAYI